MDIRAVQRSGGAIGVYGNRGSSRSSVNSGSDVISSNGGSGIGKGGGSGAGKVIENSGTSGGGSILRVHYNAHFPALSLWEG